MAAPRLITIVESMPIRYRGTVARRPAIAVLLALLATTILAGAFARGRGLQVVAYFTALALSVLMIDAVLLRRPVPVKLALVRHPHTELLAASLLFLVALGWLFSRFVSGYTIRSPILRLVAVSAVFNIPLALVLLILRYRPVDLGICFRGFAPVPLVILCFGMLAAALSPASITMKEAFQEAGSLWGLLLIGFGEAGLPEEFFRFVWQTRAGAGFNNRAAGWLLASVLWAVLHVPKAYADSHSLAGTLEYAADIIPIGLLWGYLTMRTGSILPSVLLHGTNVWGLQNL
jgi:membrane protease YdiL (CAAX protease family)